MLHCNIFGLINMTTPPAGWDNLFFLLYESDRHTHHLLLCAMLKGDVGMWHIYLRPKLDLMIKRHGRTSSVHLYFPSLAHNSLHSKHVMSSHNTSGVIMTGYQLLLPLLGLQLKSSSVCLLLTNKRTAEKTQRYSRTAVRFAEGYSSSCALCFEYDTSHANMVIRTLLILGEVTLTVGRWWKAN